MKKTFRIFLLFCILTGVLFAVSAKGSAYEVGEPYRPNLETFIQDPIRREYVEMMVDHHFRTNKDIHDALKGGFSAVFLFDGCSDNMNDPELSDLSYYRVSGVCLVFKLDSAGEPKLTYFNEDASTIPDQPLKYGAWSLPEIGEVGPATICDGTYQLYGVHHRGEYEALHVRTDYRDGTLDAIYMTPEGYEPYRANEINIHTRTSNHIANYGMWSAGCPLVGGGSALAFQRLIQSTYYTTYDTFEVGNYVGTLVLDRQQLRQELYTIYKNPDAVDAFLASSRAVQPERYLDACKDQVTFEAEEIRYTTKESNFMSLPCFEEEDARTKVLRTIPEGTKLSASGTIRNVGEIKWYRVSHEGMEGYLYSGDTKPQSWFHRFMELVKGE